jgi:orotate phosphoribosyltransferase
MASSILALFEETGAYLRGHFRLTSGLHSGEYLQCAKVLAYPQHAERLGQALTQKLRPVLEGATITVVSAPAMGGLIIGHEVARAFGAPFFFSERDAATNEMTVRRGFSFRPDDRAVVIEDVVTTGGSTREVIRVLQQAGVEVLAAGSIIDRSDGSADVGVPRVALEQMKVIAYDPENCPLCREGLPLVKPGSKRV